MVKVPWPHTTVTLPVAAELEGLANQIADFASGVDRLQFRNSTFGFGTAETGVTLGTNFFSISGYDGTNAPASGSANPYFVFDPSSLTLYHDDGLSGTGYTVVATVQSGAAVAAGDIRITGFADVGVT